MQVCVVAGPVCSLCAKLGNVTYGRTGTLQCKQCRPTGVIILAYIGSALLVLMWLSYTIHVTLAENEEAASGHNDPQKVSQLIRVGAIFADLTLLANDSTNKQVKVQYHIATQAVIAVQIKMGC